MALDALLSSVGGPPVGQVFAALGSQSFLTLPVPNRNYVLYTLSIRAPKSKQAVATYTFPLSPGAITKEFTALSKSYNTQGTPGQFGVARSVDVFGNTPPTFSLDGTTGWKFHSADGFATTGLQSVALLQRLLNRYAQLNQQQAQSNIPDLYTLEYHDYFSGEYWQVEPIGRQLVSQDAQRPLLFRYQFRWDAIVNLAAAPNPVADLLKSILGSSAVQAASSLISGGTGIANAYGALTGGAIATVAAGSALATTLAQSPAAFIGGQISSIPLFTVPGR